MEEGKEGCPLAHAFRYGDQKHMGAKNFPSRGTRVWTPLEISKMRAFLPITPPLASPGPNSELNDII